MNSLRCRIGSHRRITFCPGGIALAWCLLVALSIGCQNETAAPVAGGNQQAEENPAEESQPTKNDLVEEESTAVENTREEALASGGSDKVLRHAVFFSFKETSSAEDIQRVADAFAALPSKIDSIIDFQWGTNNSPEKLNDGFTHCFLLTFKDEQGRAEYLPHPAHQGEFADVLRPHKKDVFVIDYWGTPADREVNKELKHAVFLKFKEDATAEEIKNVEEQFAALPSKIDSIKAFEWGKNNSPEKHDHGFTHCFMVTFDSEEGRAAYLPHPDHQAFVEVLKPVLDKVRVLDFWQQ